MSSFRDDVPPWSFFIPITLAVIIGVLAADLIRHAAGIVLGRDDTPVRVEPRRGDGPAAQAAPEQARPEPAQAAEPVSTMEPDTDPVPQDGAAMADAPPVEQQVDAAEETSRAAEVLELPDSMTARRDGDPAACVNGTVVNRVQGGWEQALEGDATIPCVIVNRR